MPELPEVETVVRTLARHLENRSITAVEIPYQRIIEFPTANAFIKQCQGQHFRDFKRRGKYLIFVLDDYNLVVHLRMEGKFFVKDNFSRLTKHDHVLFVLDDGQKLYYNDVRKFGRMWLYPLDQEMRCLSTLGYEFFDKQMSVDYLLNLARQKDWELKRLLLDQSCILGVGNIYADEICWAMKKHPRTAINTLNKADFKKMISAGITILNKAITAGGTTIRSYSSAQGVSGRFQFSLKVHGRQDEKCYNCQTKILKDRVAGRGTYYCPNCQRYQYHFVAITGRRAAGKSLVLQYFSNLGFKVIDCDKIVDQLLKDEAVITEVAALLSLRLTGKHQANKSMIAARIFNDDELKKRYENFIYPLVYREIKQQQAPYTIVEVQRLFEAGFDRYFQAAIVVSSSKEQERARLLAKKVSDEDIAWRQKYQSKNSQLVAKANFVIDNDGSVAELKTKVEYLAKILKGENLC